MKSKIMLAFCLLSAAIHAADYRLVNTGTNQAPVPFSDLSNWTNLTAGAMAETLPGEADTLKGSGTIALDGAYSIGTFPDDFQSLNLYRAECAEDEVSLTVTTKLGSGTYQRYSVYDGARLVLGEGAELNGANRDAGPSIAYLFEGGVMDVFGAVNSRHTTWDVNAGATLNYAPKSYSTGGWQDSHYDIFEVDGTLNFPEGLNVVGGTKAIARINHTAGRVVFGGGVESVCGWLYTWKGGTLASTGNVTFPANFNIVVTEGASVTNEVADGKTVSYSQISFADGAVLSKTGAGDLSLGDTPSSLVLHDGTVRTVADVQSVTFAGGALALVAGVDSIAAVSSIVLAENEKAKLALEKLYLLEPGAYTVVAAGNTLSESDYEFTLDPSVAASVAVNGDGSVVLTVTGIVDDPQPLVWNPENVGDIWDSVTAAWLSDDVRSLFSDGRTALFNGEEANYTKSVTISGAPSPRTLIVSGARDYSFAGDAVNTRSVVKTGAGTLAVDGNGFVGRNIEVREGTLSFGPLGAAYACGGIAVTVPGSCTARLAAHSGIVKKLFDFKYNSGSTSWDSREEYETQTEVDSIRFLISNASPVAPDGTSLSGKSVLVSGYFKVSEEEAGLWSFKGIYDDGIFLEIDGTKLFQTTSWTDEKTASVELSEGWHAFEIRAYDGSGGWGHADCVRAMKPGTSYYLAFHEDNFDMNWYGSEIDTGLPPEGMTLDLSAGDGATVVFGSAGYVIGSLSSGADVTFAIDLQTVPANETFVSVSDPTVRATLKASVQESIGTLGTVVETDEGLAWEMDAVFSSETVTDLMDPEGWMIGVLPGADETVTIEGESTKAVMDAETTMYASMSVVNGATLEVNATRELPATSLAAGTTFKVARGDGGELTGSVTYEGYITSASPVLIANIDSSVSVLDFVGFAADPAGSAFNLNTEIASVLAKSVDGGDSLLVQFKKYDTGHVKCAIVKIWKENTSLYAQLVAARYWTTTESNLSHDFVNENGTYNQSRWDMADNDTVNGYGVKNISFSYHVTIPQESIVTAKGPFSTTGDGTASVVVEEGCVLDLSGIAVTTGAKVVKTGSGAVVFGETLPSSFEITEGDLVLQPYVAYDLSTVTIGEGVSVKVAIDGGYKVASGVDAPGGKKVFLPPATYVGVGSWNETANWSGGVLPGEEDVVHVYGAGTVLTLDEGDAVVPAKIVVEDAASFVVVTNAVLKALSLAPTANFAIGDNETKPAVSVELPGAPEACFRQNGETVDVPAFLVATNATLKFSSSAKLKNMDMVLCGKVTTTESNVGDVTFGHAVNGETAYFGLLADGATIHPLSWEGPDNTAHFVWPDEGGRVVQLRPYIFRKCSYPCSGWGDYTNPRIGVNNPLDEPCEFVFDGTHFYYNQYVYVAGAAKVRCINGSSFQRQHGIGHIGTGGAPARLEEYASIELEGEGTYFASYGQSARFSFSPDADAALDIPSLTLKDGASIKGFKIEGNGNAGLYIVNDGEWTVPRLYRFGDKNYSYPVLSGFEAAVIAEESVFRIVGRNEGQCNTGTWRDWDRNLTIDGALLGYGDVTVSNTAPTNSMTVTVVSDLNACEGSISCDGANNCSLLFADGANWAGTVVAGNVALTNLTDGAAAATVTFTTLDLAAEFPVRVWRGEDGALTNDTLHVGGYLANGGKLVPVLQTEGAEFIQGDRIVLGRIPKDAALPALASPWVAETEAIAGDDGHLLLTLRFGRGLTIIIR